MFSFGRKKITSVEAYQKGDFNSARKIAFAEVKKNPQNINSLLVIGNSFYIEGNYEKADEYYQEILKKDSENFEALVNYGISNGDALLFSKTMPSDITDRVCLFEGRSYADKKFLMSREAYSIPEDNQKKIGKLTATYAQQVQGASYDNSVYDMYPRRLNGEILDKKPRPRFSDLVSSKLSKSR